MLFFGGGSYGPCLPLYATSRFLRRRPTAVGPLHSRRADLVFGFTGSDVPGSDFSGLPGSRPSADRLRPRPASLFHRCDCGTAQTRAAGTSLLAAALPPFAGAAAGGDFRGAAWLKNLPRKQESDR